MKYITTALKNQNQSDLTLKCNSSLLQRVLALDPGNPKLATILALDMFLVGIDTVRYCLIYLFTFRK